MGRAPCCSKVGLHRGPWTPTEDSLLANYIQTHGQGQWRSLPTNAGLLRCGKSCRLRWMNYLRPDIKRGNITPDEEDLVIRLHALLGNRWSLIAGRLPGRTDNEIKNYWNTHLSKRLRSQGTDPNTHKKLSDLEPTPPKRKKTPPTDNTNKSKQTKGKANGRAAAERPKAVLHVHQPKPVRLTSLPLSMNNSNASFKSSLTSVSPSISNASGGGVPVAPPYDQFGRCGGMTSSMMMMMINDHEGAGGGPGFTVGSSTAKEEDDVAGLVVQEHPPAASDQNTLNRLYDEYLQLIKADNDHGHGFDLDLGPDPDGYQARELDSFVESLLI